VIPPGTRGPVAVTTAVYYQSVEAIVASKFLGNMTDTNNNMVLEPCVLGGRCDGRKPRTEPAVVEGAPPVRWRSELHDRDDRPRTPRPPCRGSACTPRPAPRAPPRRRAQGVLLAPRSPA